MRRKAAISSIVGGLGNQPRRHAFERRPGGDQFDHFAPGLAHHIDAAARHRADKAFALELRHRLAHRRAADTEILRQAALVEPDLGAAAIDIHRSDRALERDVRLALKICRAGQRVDGWLRPGRAGGTAVRVIAAHYGKARTHVWYTLFQFLRRTKACCIRSAIQPCLVMRRRIGLSTNSASAATIRLAIAAITKTQCHVPVWFLIRLASGTTQTAAPFAV